VSPALQPKAETWLPFTDLVFIDPPGAGHSRLLSANDAVRRRIWSSNGEIPVLAGVMRRWLEANGRLASPKLLVGESYGGFRGPRLARALVDQGAALGGMLLSPLLDYNSRSFEWEPYFYLTRLPTMAAAQRGATSRDALADVEAYATGD
jgi:carboxypeptidase C (cathepsin A)